MVARPAPEKDHALLVRAAAARREHCPGLRVWLAGEGLEATNHHTLAGELGLSACVHLLGFRSDVHRLMRAVDIPCHTSRREGIASTIPEAMVAGPPVAATAASGTLDVVRHGDSGLLAARGDGEVVAANRALPAGDAALRQRLGGAGRAVALHQCFEAPCAAAGEAALLACAGSRPGAYPQ